MPAFRACSEVQRRIVRNLLRQQGFGECSLDVVYKSLAIPVDRRRASLEEWLRDLTAAECVKIIEGLRDLREVNRWKPTLVD